MTQNLNDAVLLANRVKFLLEAIKIFPTTPQNDLTFLTQGLKECLQSDNK